MTGAVPEILFMCVHNAGRSQIAASFAEALGGGRVVVRSAGSEPAEAVNPVVREAMAEVGLDLDELVPAPRDRVVALLGDLGVGPVPR